MVNGAGKIFIERKDGTALWERRFERPEQLEDIIQQIVGRVNPGGKCVFAHCRCPSGGWLPRSYRAASGCAGRPGGDYTKVSGTDHDGKADWLWGCYRGSGTVSGRAGSCPVQYFCQRGNQFRKDDILNALSSFIPRTDRVITIEDSAELQISPGSQSGAFRDKGRQYRGKGTDYHQPVNPGFAEDESGPDHRGRGKRRRGSGYVAGYEHRPSGFSLNGPQQFSQRYAQPSGNYGFNGSQTAAGGGPKPDRFGFGYSGSSGTAGETEAGRYFPLWR